MIIMALNFKAIAQKETSLSALMENRNKIDMADIIKKYPDGVTVEEFDFITMSNEKGEENTFPVCTFKEDPTLFFFGGAVLYKICVAWVDSNEGDVAGTSDELKNQGGCKMRFSNGKTHSGRSLTTVSIV